MEAMISVVLLGLMASGFSLLYASGLNSLDEQADRMMLDSHLRSRMEILIAQQFAQVDNGSENVIVRGKNFTINWTVAPKDLNEDMTPESNAKEVTVSVAGMSDRSLTTILVDHGGKVGKL